MKRQKKKTQKKKPRVPIVGIGTDKNIEISYINIDKERRLTFKDEHGNLIEPSSITVGDAYFRSSKSPKILRQLNTDPSNIRLDTKQLLRNQDATLVVDTGYQNVRGFRLCVSASILITYKMEETRRIANFSPQSNLFFCASAKSENPERLGWWDLIDRFTKSPFYNESNSYGVVVDSELGNLSKFNKRTDTVWRQYYLPSNFQIIYASADVGQESYINQAIQICDKQATRILSKILKADNLDEIKMILDKKEYLKICYFNFLNDEKHTAIK